MVYSIQLQKRFAEIFYLSFLVVICTIVYWPVFTHQFQLLWDDQWVVINEYTEGGFNSSNLLRIFSEFYHGQYAPINELFYLTLYTLFGYDPFYFHTASLLVHISNVLLFYLLLKKLLTLSSEFSESSILRISLFASLLFGIHPFLVEAVSWMSASKCIIYVLFYFLALHSYLVFIVKRKKLFFLLTLILFIFSLGAKEQAVTFPFCLLLVDYVLKRNLQSNQVWFEKLPFFCLSVSFGILTFYSQAYNNEGILSNTIGYPLYQNFVFSFYTVTEYLIKSLIPIRLSYLYPFPIQPGEQLPIYLWLYPILFAFVILTFRKLLMQKWIFFGMIFFALHISIASNLIPTSRFAIIADRYVYLPAAGIIFLIAYLIDKAILKANSFKSIFIFISLIYAISLGVYAHQRCKVWHNSYTLKKEMQTIIQSRKDFDPAKHSIPILQ